MVQARARRPYSDRAESRPHSPLCRRRRTRAVFGLYSRLGTYVLPGVARHRSRCREGADLRRRHLLYLTGDNPMTKQPDEIVFDPRGIVDTEPLAPSARATDVNGLRLGVLDNTKRNAN